MILTGPGRAFSLNSPWPARPSAAAHGHAANRAPQQGLQLSRTEPHHPVAYRRPAELAVFQALRDEHDAGAVPEDQLYPVSPLRAEHVDHAGERIGAHRLAHQRGQPLCSLAEVDRLRRHHNPDVPGWPDHECALSARITASIARGFASAPTRTSTPAISSSIPPALDQGRARRGGIGARRSGWTLSTTAGKNIVGDIDPARQASPQPPDPNCTLSPS